MNLFFENVRPDMNRRQVLAACGATAVCSLVGCLSSGGSNDDDGPPPDDPFPDEIDDRVRGEAPAVSKTVGHDREIEDASSDCAREVRAAVRRQLEDELDGTGDVGMGIMASQPGQFEGNALSVSLTAKTYSGDEVVHESTLEFEEVLASTPHSAAARAEDGTELCVVPVYAREVDDAVP